MKPENLVNKRRGRSRKTWKEELRGVAESRGVTLTIPQLSKNHKK